MSKLFNGLKKGLEEALAHAEGKINLKSEVIEILAFPAKYSTEVLRNTMSKKNDQRN